MLLPVLEKPLRTAAIVIETEDQFALTLARDIQRLLRGEDMPVVTYSDGPIRKRFDKAARTGVDYILTLMDGPGYQQYVLRVKRQIRDRRKTRGRINVALKALLRDRFGVSPSVWKAVAADGGQVLLQRHQ
jgi:hypothetical protein